MGRAAERGLIAADTSSLQRCLAGLFTKDAVLVRELLDAERLVLPPAVLTEALSDPKLTLDNAERLRAIPLLPIHDGYWDRTGVLRSMIIAIERKAKLADCLIAQACIDHDIPLITYDRDFRHFVRAGLKFA